MSREDIFNINYKCKHEAKYKYVYVCAMYIHTDNAVCLLALTASSMALQS